MISGKVRCSACGQEGPRETSGALFSESAKNVFTVQGHSPYSGKLYFRCPRCRAFVAVNPADALECETPTGYATPLNFDVAGLVRKACPLPVWGGLYSGLTILFLVVKLLY